MSPRSSAGGLRGFFYNMADHDDGAAGHSGLDRDDLSRLSCRGRLGPDLETAVPLFRNFRHLASRYPQLVGLTATILLAYLLISSYGLLLLRKLRTWGSNGVPNPSPLEL